MRIGGCTRTVRLLGSRQVSKMDANEAERMPGLDIMGAPANRFDQTGLRLLRDPPASTTHPPFSRAIRKVRGGSRRIVVGFEGLIVEMGQLEGVTEFDVRQRITGRKPFRKLTDLDTRRAKVPHRREHANEKLPRREIVGVGAKALAECCDGVLLAMLSYKRPCALGCTRSRAAARGEAKGENGTAPKRDMPTYDHRGGQKDGTARRDPDDRHSRRAGQMGSGIAQVAAASGFQVLLVDASLDLATKAKKKLAAILDRQVDKGKMTAQVRDELLVRIAPESGPEAFARCDFAIEAASENVQLKLALLRKCDAVLPPGRWLASNTSSISLTKLAAATSRPDRVIGMHFMNPPPLMSLVEIVRAVQTSDETYALTKALATKMGKVTTTSRDAPGFLVNRILIPMLCEACFALQEGVGTPDDIDNGARLGLNHPMGPLELADLIGLDTVLAIADVLHREVGDAKYRAPTLLRNLVAAGWLGRKAGRGFYVYDDHGNRRADPA